MKLIVLLFVNSFSKLMVYGRNELNTIETAELDENQQQIVNITQNRTIRHSMKTAFKAIKELENSFFSEVLCAVTHMKTTLELQYNKMTHIKCKKNNADEAFFDTPGDIREIILSLDKKWMPKYKKNPMENIIEDIMNFKNKWLKYLFSENGLELEQMIMDMWSVSKTYRSMQTNELFIRYAYSMSRLYKLTCACHHRLLSILESKLRKFPNKSLPEVLLELVPFWSCTLEQVKFFNVLANYSNVYKECVNVKAVLLRTVIFKGVNVSIVVPYARANYGFKGNAVDLDPEEY